MKNKLLTVSIVLLFLLMSYAQFASAAQEPDIGKLRINEPLDALLVINELNSKMYGDSAYEISFSFDPKAVEASALRIDALQNDGSRVIVCEVSCASEDGQQSRGGAPSDALRELGQASRATLCDIR